MELFSDKVEGVVNDEITFRATVGVATYELYFNWLYDTITFITALDDAYRMWTMCRFPNIFPTCYLQLIINV